MQHYNSPPSLFLPPTPTLPTSMSDTPRTSEDTLYGDKDFLRTVSPPLAPKNLGRKRRTLFATATLVSLVFLATYLAIQQRVADRFAGGFEPLPFNPEDVDPPSNETYPIESMYTGVRGPPTPLFRGERLPAAANPIFDLPNIDNLLPHKQYLTSWPSAGWSESHCFPYPLSIVHLLVFPCSERRYGICEFHVRSFPAAKLTIESREIWYTWRL